MTDGLRTDEVMERLARRYEGREYAFLPQVRAATGGHDQRYADAVALGLWPSRGLYLHGFEIKVSRSDWLRELQAPEKAEAIGRYCDYWWLVVGQRSVVADGELPDGWGLLTPHGRGLKVAVPAERRPEPAEWDRGFIASLLRNATKGLVPKDVADAEFRRGHEAGRRSAERTGERARERLADLEASIEAFESASGLRITAYNGADLGAAVAAVRGPERRRVQRTLERTLRVIETESERIRAHLDSLTALSDDA